MKEHRVHNFGTYFVTTQTWGRRSVFQVTEVAELFIKTLYHYRAEGHCSLHAFVVMRDHVHLLITPLGITLERALQFIKGGFSHALTQTGRKAEVWQRGFSDHRIRNEDDYSRHLEYIHQNPVRRGRCLEAKEYPYSSANSRYELDPIPQRLKPVVLAADWHS